MNHDSQVYYHSDDEHTCLVDCVNVVDTIFQGERLPEIPPTGVSI